ncbi:unnamed protein product [Candida verbasci]|uniref:Transcriptional regulator n=1 Tax=Candida verbasci TaxID=1227364 RepID=A0A9W4XCA5_9ASCO|nr:unnamed protein product [Candida verbasci]
MYIPKKYSESNWEQIEYLIKTYPLATVITTDKTGKIIANHIPFYLKEDGDNYHLIAHIAKANPQLPSLEDNSNVLVIFQSNNTYITPNYYPGKQETHKYVPTWDFASAHIYGSSKIIDDFQFVRDQLNYLTNQQEAKKETDKWKVSDAPENYLNIMQKAITGLQISIESTECKFKFEQGMKENDINGVINGLKNDGKVDLSNLTKETNIRAKSSKQKQ